MVSLLSNAFRRWLVYGIFFFIVFFLVLRTAHKSSTFTTHPPADGPPDGTSSQPGPSTDPPAGQTGESPVISESKLALPIPANIEIPHFNRTSILVTCTRSEHDVAWLHEDLPDMPKILYDLERRDAPYHVPEDKGNEAMAYLTYIIDHYDTLPDVVLFFRGERITNDNNLLLDNNSAETIRRLSLDRVSRVGFMNARCQLDPGCPNWIHFGRSEADRKNDKKPEEPAFSVHLWRQLFPIDGSEDKNDHRLFVPRTLSAPTGSQFAVTKEKILARSRSDYIFFRKWIIETPIESDLVGQIFSFLWQYIFTGYTDVCPAESSCHCDGYGVCFGGQAKLDRWMDMHAHRARLVDSLRALERPAEGDDHAGGGDDTKSGGDQKDGDRAQAQLSKTEMETKVKDLTEKLRAGKEAAFKAGQALANRKLEAEIIEEEA